MYLVAEKRRELGYKNNHNVLVLGAPGTGKTRHHVIPGLLNGEFSMVLLDPKGELYDMTRELMEERGYKVLCIDFKEPHETELYYNPLMHIRRDHHMSEDIIKLTKILVADQDRNCKDVFWPKAAQLLANALTAFLVESCNVDECNFESMTKLLRNMSAAGESVMDVLMKELKAKNPKSFAVEQYELFKTVGDSEKTFSSIVISLVTTFAESLSEGMKHLTRKNTLDFKVLGDEKTVLYIKSSDTDRSKDCFISMLFVQMFDELCSYADSLENHALKNHTHMYLEDFGTNLCIPAFDVYIAAMRSREISCSVILQSEGQLKKMYGESWSTIISSCGSYLFMGTNDLETCKNISQRVNRPLEEILYKKQEDIYLFEQNEMPHKGKRYDIKNDSNYKYVREL